MKKTFARKLRKGHTDPESILWYHLRDRRFLGYKFRRQMPVRNFIIDFVCVEKQLVIELDGGQHAENIAYDENRTKILNDVGFTVLRFWNNQILMDLENVLDEIYEWLNPEV